MSVSSVELVDFRFLSLVDDEDFLTPRGLVSFFGESLLDELDEELLPLEDELLELDRLELRLPDDDEDEEVELLLLDERLRRLELRFGSDSRPLGRPPDDRYEFCTSRLVSLLSRLSLL